MPKFKEVVPLRTMALDLFIESVIQCCNRLSVAQDRDLFHRGVVTIRRAVHDFLPWRLLAEFGNRFFEKFRLRSRDRQDYKVGLEMIMDINIVGLRLKGFNLDYLDLKEGHRFPAGLGELDLSGTKHTSYTEVYECLHTYNRDYLTTFVSEQLCRDDCLAIIGELCQNLEVLKIMDSRAVTDGGLRALSRCSNLRCVHFRQCPQVSHIGLNHLLSAHKKLEDFYYEPHDNFVVPNFDTNIDVSSGVDLSVTVPSLKSLLISIGREFSRPLNLSVIVEKFPNLVNLEINCPDALNLSALKHMEKLTGLRIYFRNGMCNEMLQRTWENIEEILAFIGPQITGLTLWARHRRFSCQQEQLDMIHDRCPNLEQLAFDHANGTLEVPEFDKLKALALRSRRGCSLKFGTMSNLETLSLTDIEETRDLETEILSCQKFPKLSVLGKHTWGIRYRPRYRVTHASYSHSEEVERIIKDNNFDIRLVDLDSTPIVRDHFTYNWFNDSDDVSPDYDSDDDTPASFNTYTSDSSDSDFW